MTEPAGPGGGPASRPGDLRRPESAPPAAPSQVQPQKVRPDEGETTTVGTEREAIPPAPEAVPVKPRIDPALAAQEKPASATEDAAKPLKDPQTTAAESAHERGFATILNDAYITSRVKMSLAIDGATPAADINVDTEDGKVTLFGIVPTEEARTAAETDAKAVVGVVSVENTLQVVAEDRKPDVEARDTELQGSLQKNLQPYRSMSGAVIDVKNCVVRLTGTVEPGSEHDEAMQVVRRTPGVCQVKDELRFAAS